MESSKIMTQQLKQHVQALWLTALQHNKVWQCSKHITEDDEDLQGLLLALDYS